MTEWKLALNGEVLTPDGFIMPPGGTGRQMRINGRLIAAAPKMYEALKEVQREALKSERTDLLEIITPAIAKAEGE